MEGRRMIREISLPDLGEGLTESELVSWEIAVGDTVQLNQVIAEVETAKALVQLPSPFAGVVSALHVDPGATVQVGATIVSMEVADDASAGSSAPERTPVLVGYGPPVENGARPQRKRPSVQPEPQPEPAPGNLKVEAPSRPRSTPPVRKLAADLGVELSSVAATGPDGTISRADVQAAAPSVREAFIEAVPQLVPESSGRETRIPIRGMRKHTADAMVRSAFTAPHVTEFLTIDVTPTMELLDRLRARPEFAETRLTVLAIVARALCLAVGRNPTLNSFWDEGAGEIVQFGYVNLGLAVATPRGLLVPNLRDADGMSLAELAAAIDELAGTARAGSTTPQSLAHGTISITNVGVFGIDAGTPILNPGEAAILAMGAVRRMPWEYRGEVALRQVMTLSLSFDHRLVDGEQGSRFLADIGRILADPAMALAMS
jgi:2-oxoisovalerate dehydrogenase E2 component (dihydrolipoyl transacylase)